MTHDIPLRLNHYYLAKDKGVSYFYFKVDAIDNRTVTCSILGTTSRTCEHGVTFKRSWLEDNLQMEIQNEARIVELKLRGLV